jgi:hypothetical protein
VSVASKTQSDNLGIAEGSVRIISAQYFHSNGCLPNVHQLVDQKKRVGLYNKPLHQNQLGHLIQLVDNNQKVPPIMMRNAMRPLYPESVPIDSKLIANMRIKIKALIRKREYNKEQLWNRTGSKLPSHKIDSCPQPEMVKLLAQ